MTVDGLFVTAFLVTVLAAANVYIAVLLVRRRRRRRRLIAASQMRLAAKRTGRGSPELSPSDRARP